VGKILLNIVDETEIDPGKNGGQLKKKTKKESTKRDRGKARNIEYKAGDIFPGLVEGVKGYR